MKFRESVNKILTDLEELLVSKNEKYGNSALEPKRVFSKANTVEQLKVRIDDKLSRMSAGTNDNEDTVTDLMGYLVLLKIAEQGEVDDIDDTYSALLKDDEHQANLDMLKDEARAIRVHLQPDGTFIVDCNGYDYDTVIEMLKDEFKLQESKV